MCLLWLKIPLLPILYIYIYIYYKLKGVMTHYCMYGFDYKKPTFIFSNVNLQLKKCSHKKHSLNLNNVQTNTRRSVVPKLLIIEIFETIRKQKMKRKNTQKKENIIHIDNMEWLQKQKDNSVDLMITSPPYNIDYWKVHSYKDNKKQLDYEREQIDFINESLRVLKPYGAFFYIHMNRYEKNQSISPYRWILKTKAKINQEIIWDKKDTGQWRNNKFAPMDEKIFWLYKEKTFPLKRGAQIFSSIWRIDRATTKDNKGHKATFPKQLIYRIINSLDVSKDIKILDAYTGTGTTNQVANHLGFENNIGLDNLEKWVKIAKIKQYEYLQFDEDIPQIQNKYTPKNNIIEKNKKAKAKVATPKQFHQMSLFEKKEV